MQKIKQFKFCNLCEGEKFKRINLIFSIFIYFFYFQKIKLKFIKNVRRKKSNARTNTDQSRGRSSIQKLILISLLTITLFCLESL